MFRGLKHRWVNFCVNKLYAGTKEKYFEKKRKLLNSIGHKIGEGTKIVGPVFCTGKLIVGKNCWIGRGFTVDGNGLVVIGDNCDIAPEVSFQTGGHKISNSERRAGEGYNMNIEVGRGCWICARATILGGVTIFDGCVIASCACVNKSVRENMLVGGVPARELRILEND